MPETPTSPIGEKPLTFRALKAKFRQAGLDSKHAILPEEEYIGAVHRVSKKERRIQRRPRKATNVRRKIKEFNEKLAEGVLVHNPKELQLGPIIREILAREDYHTRKSNAIMIAERLVETAKQGNLMAITEILNRVDGRVTEKHEISSAPITLVFKPADSDSALITPTISAQVEILPAPIEGQIKELEGTNDSTNSKRD